MASKWTPGWAAALVGVLVFPAAVFFGVKSLLTGISMGPLIAKQVREARIELSRANTDTQRCYPLARIAKDDFNHGNLREAKAYAEQLLAIAAKIQSKNDGALHSEYGVAIHDGNVVLGRIALRENRKADAEKYLLAAGKTTGAATLNSFGPNMSLAKDLAEAGDGAVVIRYLDECRKFWTLDPNKLDDWEAEIKSGGVPDFGANLYY